MSLPWPPFLHIEDCDKEGQNCKENYGFLIDLSALLEKKLNMTIRSDKEPNNEWGINPRNQKYDFTGDWFGVMGKVMAIRFLGSFEVHWNFCIKFQVIKEECDFSLSAWYHLLKREPLMDFATVIGDYLFLVLTPQPADTDTGLFTRPFTTRAWLSLSATVVALLIASVAPYAAFPADFFEQTTSFRLVHVSMMGFFLLINAFYGGALTMFFTSELGIPFHSIRDVIQDNDWDVIVKKGGEAVYHHKSDFGDPDFMKLVADFKRDPEKFMFKSAKEGLAMIRDSRC